MTFNVFIIVFRASMIVGATPTVVVVGIAVVKH